MVLSYYGFSCFKIQSGDTVLVIDPFGKGADLPAPRFETHVVAYTKPGTPPEFSLGGAPMILSTPGEYEVREIFLTGFDAAKTTPFLIEWEGIRLMHLGTLQKEAAVTPLLDHIDTIDILFISTAGFPSEAHKIISAIDPRIIIPMHGESAKKSSFDSFIKEIGEKVEKLDRLTIKQKTLPAEGQRMIILGAE